MPKRANKEGGIYPRKDGRWEYRYTVTDRSGIEHLRSGYAASQAEATKKKLEAQAQVASGLYVDPDKITVGQWLHVWFEEYFLPSHRASTASVYLDTITCYLVPALGSMRLQKLRPEHIQAFVNAQEKSPTTIKKMIEVLSGALKQAVENSLILSNPARKVKLPKQEQKEIEFLTLEEQKKLLEALPDTDSGRALRFILQTGLRASELSGLRWQDIKGDFFRVNQVILRVKCFDGEQKTQFSISPPKSKAGQRDIPLTQKAREIIDIQRREYLQHKLRAGSIWEDYDLVFCTPIGTPKDAANLRRTLRDALKKAGLKHRGLHALRHSFATNAVRAGMDLRTLTEIIGHAKVAFTMQTYVHSDLDTKTKAMQMLENLF